MRMIKCYFMFEHQSSRVIEKRSKFLFHIDNGINTYNSFFNNLLYFKAFTTIFSVVVVH